MGRKLIFIFDGSSNSVAGASGVVPTNMYYLNQAFSNGTEKDPQISFYFSGVGAGGDKFAAITGKGLDEIVIDAYTNLASNYVGGDLLYVFGFSRGALAARLFSALLSFPGLLTDTDLSFRFPLVWDLFTDRSKKDGERRRELLSGDLQRSLRTPAPKIEFLGVFDTVPGYGWDRTKHFIKLRIRNFRLEASVRRAVHILSIDDNRNPSFAPLLWTSTSSDEQSVEQIWMPGVHGDVGGHSDSLFLGDLSLLTMLERVEHYCPELQFDTAFVGKLENETFHPSRSIHISNERSGMWDYVLRNKRRTPGGPGQSKHYMVDGLIGRRIQIRGKTRPYEADHMRSIMSSHTTKYASAIDIALSRYPR